MTDAASQKGGSTPPGQVLLLLLLGLIFNFLDRQIISILAVPIKADLTLTDTQLGLMGGLAFTLCYSSFGIPIAWAADRWSRVNIISSAVAVWSIFTAICGFTQNFWQLFMARVGVGIGEAGGVAPSQSLITDYFPSEKRGRALAIFSFGIPIGSAFGMLFGGWIASHVDWRAAFLVIGLAGIPLALIIKLGIKEPVRGGYDREAGTTPLPASPFGVTMKALRSNPSFWLLSFAGAFNAMVIYGLMFWLPSFFARSFDLTLAHVSYFYGAIILIGGIAGIWLGGWLGDRLGKARPSAYAMVPAISVLLAAPAYALGLFAPNLAVAFILFLIPQILGSATLAPMVTATQHIVPPNMRATGSASFALISSMIGIGFGTFFFGFMSDQMTAAYGQHEALRYSILYGLGFYLVSALLFGLAALRLNQDWYVDRRV